MHFNKAIAAAILAFCATKVLAAPLPQLHGEGVAADALLTDTDNGVGYGVENAEDNLAGNVATVKAAVPAAVRRQLHGEGVAADALLTDTDNGVGYGIENAEDNLAGNVATVKAAVPATPAAVRRQLHGEGVAADALLTDTDNGVGYGIENAEDNVAADITAAKATARLARRQLDKVANGAQAVSDAAGTGAVTTNPTNGLKGIDGALTDGAANTGTDVGNAEAATLEDAGSSVPKQRRQLDKVANGAQAVSDAAGTGSLTTNPTNGLKGIDGALTDGAANTGTDVGAAEAATLEDAGSSVPKSRRQLDKISNGAQAISNSAGTGATTTAVTNALDSADGTLTDGAANAGTQVGNTEASTLEGAGAAVPKRF